MSASGSFEMDRPDLLWVFEETVDSIYRCPAKQNSFGFEHSQRTLNPKIVGGSVLGLRFRDGAVIAADTLGSYGTLARFRNCERLFKVNDTTVIGASGDFADFQYITSQIAQQVIVEECLNDGFGFTPQSLHCVLTRLLYSRRSRLNPLWNTIVVAGLEDNRPYTGYVDLLGTAYESPSTACGFGAYIAQPIMRAALEKNPNLSAEEAVELINRCMKLLYYRDALAYHKYQIATITRGGVAMQGPVAVQTNWETAHMVSNSINYGVSDHASVNIIIIIAMPVSVGGHGLPFHSITRIMDQFSFLDSTLPLGQSIQRLLTEYCRLA